MKRSVLALSLWLVALPAAAETQYVIDRIHVALRDGPTDTAAALKTLESGAALEVLERAGNFVRVRDAQGVEGWMDARYLSTEPPARQQLAVLHAELARARAELKELRIQLAQSRARLEPMEAAHAPEKARAEGKPEAAADTPPPAAPAPTAPPGPSWFSVLWLVVSFAMLGIGFALGVFWLREHHRKKLGGMYLRI